MWPELLHFDFWFLSHFLCFALPVIPDSCSSDKHCCGLFLSPVLERTSFLQRQCASLHRSLNQWRILIISYSIMQLTIIYIYEICLTFTTIALLLAQWLLNSLFFSPPHFHSPWLHLSVYGCNLHHCSWASHRLATQAFFAYSFCLALSLGTQVILSLLKGSSSIQVCSYLRVKAVIVCATTLWVNCLLIEVIRAIKTIEE